MYVELPLGWRRLNGCGLKEKFKENHVLKLDRSVYGLKQSPKNSFKLLKGNLEKCGFRQSDFDSCLFISEKVACACYVDDCLFFAPKESDIHPGTDTFLWQLGTVPKYVVGILVSSFSFHDTVKNCFKIPKDKKNIIQTRVLCYWRERTYRHHHTNPI